MTYQDRKSQFATTATALEQKYNRFSIIRLLSFIIGIAVIILAFTYSALVGCVVLFVLLLAFAKFIFWHQQILKEKQHYEALTAINQAEIDIANGEYATFANGSEYLDLLHPYAIDLDIFGDYSLFQYLNRTATNIGEKTFAKYLLSPAEKPEIVARQIAGKDLKNRLDWRQNFQAIGHNSEENEQDIRRLLNWLNDEPILLNNKVLRFAKIALPIIFFASVATIYFGIPYQFSVIIFILNLVVLGRKLKEVNVIHEKTSKAGDILNNYARLIEHIENEDFEAEKLKDLKQRLFISDRSASKSMKGLAFIIHQLNARFNIFAILLNGTFLWDWHWILKLEKWKAEMQTKLPEWFDILQEFDAMITLGTLQYNHDDWTMPTIDEEFTGLEGIELGHPLIDAKKRVPNDLIVPNSGHIKLITGSNMAGKSTYLRTVGLNIVLAMTGSPVCAKSLRLPILTVNTSMRTQDVLHESTSSFYAELKRLKTIIDSVENGEKVFFLLDEILKGTNSRDRHTGSRALIEQLIKSKGMGLIATHDLELG
ncbi:MAG: hypothetical protein AB8G11_08240, partial [Saprospiraceae bacterium]